MPYQETDAVHVARLLAVVAQLASEVHELAPAVYLRPLRELSRDELEHALALLAARVDPHRLAPAHGDNSPASAYRRDMRALLIERFGANVARERHR